jgi:hypothetical protein
MSIRSRKPLLATIWKVDAGRSGKSESGMGIQLLFKFFYVGIFFLFVLCAYTKILSLEKKIKFNRIFVNVLCSKALNEQKIQLVTSNNKSNNTLVLNGPIQMDERI